MQRGGGGRQTGEETAGNPTNSARKGDKWAASILLIPVDGHKKRGKGVSRKREEKRQEESSVPSFFFAARGELEEGGGQRRGRILIISPTAPTKRRGQK